MSTRFTTSLMDTTTEHTFTKLQFVENGRLSGGVETNHQDAHFFLSELNCHIERKEKQALVSSHTKALLPFVSDKKRTREGNGMQINVARKNYLCPILGSFLLRMTEPTMMHCRSWKQSFHHHNRFPTLYQCDLPYVPTLVRR